MLFKYELDQIQDNIREEFEKSRFLFDVEINEEQFSNLMSFSMAHLHMPTYTRWENNKILEESLKETVGRLFKNEKEILPIYQNFKSVRQFLYEKDITEALGEDSKKINI